MADKIKDERIAKFTPPKWLEQDALNLWNKTLTQVTKWKDADIVFDVLDEELLAIFCEAVVEFRKVDEVEDLQAWSRIVTACGDKLGLTPRARARLKKKKLKA